ncbi:VQ motif-containing protein [Carex littledalei]|uniref:VQ motif-containing protein n=1 Tax=Carex littledalei TaxID=544730 RepID=A0A833R1D0_9POAL|nr:VQ motif-containing protein [Carex littledalei]
MKKNKRKQSNPTLTELLDPYLRNPPSPPLLSPPQSPAPQSLPLASLHTVQRVPAKPWRQFHRSSPQFYQVHPRDFRDLVQRLTGASAANNNGQPKLEERQVEDIDNGPGIEEEWMLPDMGTCHLDR